jgi:hypothetical protein
MELSSTVQSPYLMATPSQLQMVQSVMDLFLLKITSTSEAHLLTAQQLLPHSSLMVSLVLKISLVATSPMATLPMLTPPLE